MTLGDMENYLLFQLQQPGANFSASMPDWSKQINPQFNQGAIDFFINAGYTQVFADTADFAPYPVFQSFPSIAQTWNYLIPQPIAGVVYPRLGKLLRVVYSPLGQNYDYDYDPGIELVSWSKFQQCTSRGMLQRYAFGTKPTIVSLAIDRRSLCFYPGSASTGDNIEIAYVPIPTAGASEIATLVNEADAPVLDEDYHEAIVLWALSKLWLRSREKQQSDDTRSGYENEIVKLRARHLTSHAGDTFGAKMYAAPMFIGD